MMHHVTGVRTVAVGGLPQPGPIQTLGGNRGAQIYTSFDLDYDIDATLTLNDTANATLPTNRDDLNFTVKEITFNLRDQVRKNENFPLQFAYDAADCRIFWTLKSINNYTDLWTRAASAIRENGGLCVADSTGYATIDTDKNGPPEDSKTAWDNGQTIAEAQAALAAFYNHTMSTALNDDMSMDDWIISGLEGGLEDHKHDYQVGGGSGDGHSGDTASGDGSNTVTQNQGQECNPNSAQCPGGQLCVKSVPCRDDGTYNTALPFRCKKRCSKNVGCNHLGTQYRCNELDVSCTGKAPCQSLSLQTGSWCELSPKGANCKHAALINAQNYIKTQNFKHPAVFNVPRGGR